MVYLINLMSIHAMIFLAAVCRILAKPHASNFAGHAAGVKSTVLYLTGGASVPSQIRRDEETNSGLGYSLNVVSSDKEEETITVRKRDGRIEPLDGTKVSSLH